MDPHAPVPDGWDPAIDAILLRARRLTDADWKLILPYLEENERLFDIQVERDLLSVNGKLSTPRNVYTKVIPRGKHDVDVELETE